MSPDFGELRSLMQRPPSAWAWEELCELFDRWEPASRAQEAIPYALAHLRRWPPWLREAPARWVRWAMQGRGAERLQLAKVIRLEDERRVEALLEAIEALPSPPALYALSVQAQRLDGALVARLDRSPSLRQLHTLELTHDGEGARPQDEQVLALARCARLRPRALSMRGLSLTSEQAWRALGQAEAFGQVRRLDLGGSPSLSDAQVVQLGRSSGLARLDHLGLSEIALEPGTASALLKARRLKGLDLFMTTTQGDELAQALAEAAALASVQLTHLDVGATSLGDAGLQALLASLGGGLRTLQLGYNPIRRADGLSRGQAPALERLGLHDTWIEDEALAQLGQATGLPKLRWLNLDRCAISPVGLEALLTPALPALESLRLRQTTLGQAGARALARAPQRFRALTLSGTGLDEAACRRLVDAPPLRALEALALGSNPIGDESVAALTRAGQLEQVRTLELSYCGLGDEALVSLAMGRLEALANLSVVGNAISDHGVIALVSSMSARRLHTLNVGPRQWSMAGIKALALSPRLRRLERLDTWRSDLTPEQAQLLARSPYLPTASA